MPKYLALPVYSAYVDQLSSTAPSVPAPGVPEAEPEPALFPYPHGTAGPPVSVSMCHIDLRLGITAESIVKHVPADLSLNQVLIWWGNKPSQGEVSPLEFWLPSCSVCLAFGASPDEKGTFPMLWTPDSAMTDEGILEPVLLKAIADQLHAPCFDIFDVMVHFDTREPA